MRHSANSAGRAWSTPTTLRKSAISPTSERPSDIKTVLDGAAFRNRPVDDDSQDDLGHRARDLIDRVKDLAERDDRAER
jgi:hypothetical protein